MPPRRPGLDTLRACAIAWVMLYHLERLVRLPAIAHLGWMGVDLLRLCRAKVEPVVVPRAPSSGAAPRYSPRRSWPL